MFERLLPNTLQRYVLRQFVWNFALALTACTLFILLMFLFVTAVEWESYGMSVSQVALLSPYLLPMPLAYAIPLAVLIASTMVFGRLCAENEILAAQAGGAPIRVLAMPVLFCGLLICVASLWCTQGGLRWGWACIKDDVLKINKPASFIKNLEKEGNSFSMPLEGGIELRINIMTHVLDKETGLIRKPIHISYFNGQDVGQTLLAEDYEYDAEKVAKAEHVLSLRLINAQVLGAQPAFYSEIEMAYALPPIDKIINIGDSTGKRGWMVNWADARSVGDSLTRRRKYVLQRTADLGAMMAVSSPMDVAAPIFCASTWYNARVASEHVYGQGGAVDRIRANESECFRKLSLSLIPFSMAILGIGLGLLVRKSQLLIGFLLGIAIYAAVYYPMMIVSKEMAVAGVCGKWILFLPNLIFLFAGYALWRAYERGWLGSSNIGTKLITVATALVVPIGLSIWRQIEHLRGSMIGLLSKKTDGYIAGSFLVPLMVVLLSVATLYTAMDLVEHGEQVVSGIEKASEKRPGFPLRTSSEAVLDAGTYYAIRAIELLCDLLPLLILLAGVLCVFTLVRSNEHLILKSSGVPLQRALRPILIATALISVGVTVLRETLMPELIMRRDYLKPLVYHREVGSSALALHTTDVSGNPVLFQMSQYNSRLRTGRDLRVYLLSEAKDQRMPAIVADQAVWEDGVWKLRTELHPLAGKPSFATLMGGRALPSTDEEESDPAARSASNATPASPSAIATATAATAKEAGPKKGEKGEKGSGTKNTASSMTIVPYGFIVRPDPSAGADASGHGIPDKKPVNSIKTHLTEWRGGVTPAIIESGRLGTAVMNLSELLAASGVKRDYAIEFFRRIFEVMMALFLLWAGLPLLLKEESKHQFLGIGFCILIAAAYWGMNAGCAGAARGNWLPLWAPVIPHALFMMIGIRNFWFKMET